jgi:hypothetical protein
LLISIKEDKVRLIEEVLIAAGFSQCVEFQLSIWFFNCRWLQPTDLKDSQAERALAQNDK